MATDTTGSFALAVDEPVLATRRVLLVVLIVLADEPLGAPGCVVLFAVFRVVRRG